MVYICWNHTWVQEHVLASLTSVTQNCPHSIPVKQRCDHVPHSLIKDLCSSPLEGKIFRLTFLAISSILQPHNKAPLLSNLWSSTSLTILVSLPFFKLFCLSQRPIPLMSIHSTRSHSNSIFPQIFNLRNTLSWSKSFVL